jgi:selenocysteine-specific elongation factor
VFVVGTAGHVDHGKSTLVKALTGIDPDRLQEEKAREMTIDLGFAWLTLPGGREVSVVDVPGHERFIKNMLAGVGGIDAALLVVAADEGVMPQTSEHLAILDLLSVSRGVVALTKRDMVDDEWLELVREETIERLEGTSLERAPLVAVSARTGEGLPELLAALEDVLSEAEQRPARGVPRLPVDRVFSVQGFGTVVTGTLLDGPLRVGQEVQLLPSGARSRVRGLQSHKHKVEQADPGRRLAVNLAALPVEEIKRGDVLAPAGALEPTKRFDARIRLIADAPRPLGQGQRLDLFVGAAETVATVSLLDRDELRPGESCHAQLRTVDRLVLARDDRFILRQPSPSFTIGGGVVLDAHPRRHRRKTEETLRAMATLERGTPEDLLLAALARSGPLERSGLLKALGQNAGETLQRMVDAGEVELAVPGDDGPHALVFSAAQWRSLAAKVADILAGYHKDYPLRAGMPKEELKSRLRLEARAFGQVLQGLRERRSLVEEATTVRLPGFEVRLEGEIGREAERVLGAVRAGGYTPPAPADLGAGSELLAALVETGRLVKLTDSVVYPPDTYSSIVEDVLGAIDREGSITVAQARDRFGISRKYALAILEHLDAIKVTRRQGDERVRR